MPRQLLLLRHAKSAWDTDAPSDFERPLAKRGKQDAPRMGAWMRQQGLIPDRVLSSPARRARQTVERVCAELGLDRGAIVWEPRIYAEGAETLLDVLAACPEEVRLLLLVGHNPALEELLGLLAGAVQTPADGKLLPTGTLAQLEVPGPWSELGGGCARLRRIVRPKALAS